MPCNGWKLMAHWPTSQTAPVITCQRPGHSRKHHLVNLPPYPLELNPVESVWEYLRGNKLAITVFESYDDIVDRSCASWRFFAGDPEHVVSITSRAWATVNVEAAGITCSCSMSKLALIAASDRSNSRHGGFLY